MCTVFLRMSPVIQRARRLHRPGIVIVKWRERGIGKCESRKSGLVTSGRVMTRMALGVTVLRRLVGALEVVMERAPRWGTACGVGVPHPRPVGPWHPAEKKRKQRKKDHALAGEGKVGSR